MNLLFPAMCVGLSRSRFMLTYLKKFLRTILSKEVHEFKFNDFLKFKHNEFPPSFTPSNFTMVNTNFFKVTKVESRRNLLWNWIFSFIFIIILWTFEVSLIEKFLESAESGRAYREIYRISLFRVSFQNADSKENFYKPFKS